MNLGQSAIVYTVNGSKVYHLGMLCPVERGSPADAIVPMSLKYAGSRRLCWFCEMSR